MEKFNDDLLDEGLQGVMGKDRCQDLCGERTVAKKETVHNVAVSKKEKAMNARWEPVRENTYMDKLKACAKDALLFGGLSMIFFYFQQTGQMLPSAAMPCICVCCILLGLGVGKNAR